MANKTILRAVMLGAALLLALLAGACGGEAQRRASGIDAASVALVDNDLASSPRAGLPALSELSALAPPAARQASLTELISIPSTSYVDSSGGINQNPPNITITAAQGNIGYAIYRAGPFDANIHLVQLSLFLSDVQNDYFLFLPDWNLGRWDLEHGALTGDFTRDFPENSAQYISPDGYLFFALVTDGGFVLYNHAELTIDNLTPLPPPAAPLATPGDGFVQLDWPAYGDPRADRIDVYYADSIDMSAATLAQSLDPGLTTWTVDGLDNGTLYFFGLKAGNADGASAFSDLAAATPSASGPLPFQLASGCWARLGGSAEGSGTSTTLTGPPNFLGEVSVALTAEDTGLNRTSPVLDPQGNVYALSRNGILSSYTGDLQTLRYSFDANDYAPNGESYVCPPHAPCLDAAGNAYFIVAREGSTGNPGFIFGVRPSGSLLFQHSLGLLRDDNSVPYASPNIGPGGVLVTVSDGLSKPVGLNQDGSQAWLSDNLNASSRFFADPAFNPGNGCFNWPAVFEGFSPGLVPHSLSLQQSDGTELPGSDYRDLGAPQNLAGGCSLRDDLFCYPENSSLLLIDSTSGLRKDTLALNGVPRCAPSRVANSDYIVLPVPPNGVQSFLSRLRCVRLDTSADPPQISSAWELELGFDPVYSRAAVDKDGLIYVADAGGKLWLAYFDHHSAPAEGINPALADVREADGVNTFNYNSFALGNHAAYIVSEQNQLMLLFNPLD